MSQFLNGDIPEHVVYYKKVKIGFHIIKCINEKHTVQGLRRNDTHVFINNDTFCEVMAILNVADTSTERCDGDVFLICRKIKEKRIGTVSADCNVRLGMDITYAIRFGELIVVRPQEIEKKYVIIDFPRITSLC